MSRDCYETSETLITPHIEIDWIVNYGVVASGYVNVSAFEDAIRFLLPPK
ncbi:MAG: hypothetical protein ABH804_00175 [archaeon]